jgi:hypothetical protein
VCEHFIQDTIDPTTIELPRGKVTVRHLTEDQEQDSAEAYDAARRDNDVLDEFNQFVSVVHDYPFRCGCMSFTCTKVSRINQSGRSNGLIQPQCQVITVHLRARRACSCTPAN